jgi:hypothetical protein
MEVIEPNEVTYPYWYGGVCIVTNSLYFPKPDLEDTAVLAAINIAYRM